MAVRPRLLQAELLRTPAYLIYWPLYRDGINPSTVAERRESLNGYVTAAVKLEDLLHHALRDAIPLQATIVFRARNPEVGGAMELVGSYRPEGRLTVTADRACAADPVPMAALA